MENKNYYPLRVGKYASCIVSDMPVTHRNKKEMDSEWEHYGGFVIAESLPSEIAKELVEVFNQKYEPKEETSTSFIENMEMDSISNDKSVFEPNKPTIDDQIAFMKNSRHSILGSDDAIYTAIIENLEAIKRWNETPVYHGEIDVAKVIEDLIAMIIDYGTLLNLSPSYIDCKVCIQTGKLAIEMINRFKEEREAGMAPREAPEWIKKHAHVTTRPLTPKDVVEAHHAGVNILNRKAMYEYIPQKERDQLVDQIKRDLFSVFEGRSHKLANTIIFAIEQMDHLKRKHGR